ncbi:MAG TPA: LPS export ABC transporter periplasmic protein LptC [Alphaproteobacteria bacterium]|nr:LPS export ABC transporter periplasmic protein LptC [Alphaproteobacteria bacterium]
MNEGQSRLEELNVTQRDSHVSRGYTRFVKLMRFALPLAAVALTVIVISWPEMDDKIVIIPKDELVAPSENDIGENELLNPNFETTDAQQQPVNVTAERALQNQQDPNLVKLDKPNADLKMKDGSDVHIEALQGTYEQGAEKLFLQDDVKVRHQSGYELQAKELRVDMKTREAFSDKKVRVVGPDATIHATGLEGNVEDGILIFKGPATLTLSPAAEEKTETTDDTKQNIEGGATQ